MIRQKHARRWLIHLTLVALFMLAVMPTLGQTGKKEAKSAQPSIHITKVPRKGGGPDEMEPIAGTTSGVNPKEYRVVIYAQGGPIWYVQPYDKSPYTAISKDGKWETDTHLGSQYAALLVKPSYSPPTKTATLPIAEGGVVAIIRVPAKE